MKLLKIIIPILILSSCSGNIHTVRTKINKEIDPQLRNEINLIQITLIEGIKNKEYQNVLNLLSPKLKESEIFDIETFIDKISPLMTNNSFTISDQYYSEMEKVGGNSTATIIPSFTEDKLIINNLAFYGNKSYNLFLKSVNPGRQFLFFISMSEYDEEWKINIMHIGDYAISNLTAPELYEIAKDLKDKNRLTSATLYSLTIKQLLRPAPYLQYKDEKKYKEFIESSINEMNDTMKFPFVLSDINIIGMNIEITNKEGLIPVILYITKINLNDSGIEEEAKQVKKQIIEIFYGIENDFNLVVMRAYNEMPSDPNRKYDIYNTIIELNGR